MFKLVIFKEINFNIVKHKSDNGNKGRNLSTTEAPSKFKINISKIKKSNAKELSPTIRINVFLKISFNSNLFPCETNDESSGILVFIQLSVSPEIPFKTTKVIPIFPATTAPSVANSIGLNN